MLDVTVTLLRGGVVINGSGESKRTGNSSTAALGKAVLGTMKLGAA